jgi:tetratricopeptide (TPR) repeat protein
MLTRFAWIVVTIVMGIVAALVPHLKWREAEAPVETLSITPPVGLPGGPATSADGLRQRISDMEKRLRERPNDTGAAVLLADALLRQARVTTDGRLTARAGEVLKSVLNENPAHYDALRTLGAIYLSQHRFREALQVGRRASDLRPNDAWNYGVMGDALIELGEYNEGFDAFDTMATMRPGAAAYARVAYARELQGNLKGALQAMQMAGEATTAHDPEAQAWYAAQVGELYLRMGQLEDADREYRRAAFMFPNHPFAVIGQGTVKVARGDRQGALAIYLDQLQRIPTLDLAARIGDLYAEGGNSAEAERYYRLAEDLAGPSIAQTEANFALFLAERGRKLPEAVRMAEAVAAMRHDIFTEDALAWSYYKTGRVAEAFAASQRALRTGTRDERILAHAAAIRAAVGQRDSRVGPAPSGGVNLRITQGRRSPTRRSQRIQNQSRSATSRDPCVLCVENQVISAGIPKESRHPRR